MGCHFLLQGIFPTQGLNPSLHHCRQMLYPLSHQGSPYNFSDSFPLYPILGKEPSIVAAKLEKSQGVWSTENVPHLLGHSDTCAYSVAQLCPTLCDPMDWSPPGSSCPRDFPGKNTEVGCHFLLQGIFPIYGSNPLLLHSLAVLALAGEFCHYHHLGSPSDRWGSNSQGKFNRNPK